MVIAPTSWPRSLTKSDSLYLEQLHIRVVPDWGVDIAQVDDSPHVGAEPHGSAGIALVLADQNGVWHRKETHKGAVLQESQNLRLVRQTSEKVYHTITYICRNGCQDISSYTISTYAISTVAISTAHNFNLLHFQLSAIST